MAVLILQYSCTFWILIERLKKKLVGGNTRILEEILEAACHKTAAVWPLIFYLAKYPRRTRHAAYCW